MRCIQAYIDALNQNPEASYNAIYGNIVPSPEAICDIIFSRGNQNELDCLKTEMDIHNPCYYASLYVSLHKDKPATLMPSAMPVEPEIEIYLDCHANLPWPCNGVYTSIIHGETYDGNKCRFYPAKPAKASHNKLTVEPSWSLNAVYQKSQENDLKQHWQTLRHMSDFLDAYKAVQKSELNAETKAKNAMRLVEASQRLFHGQTYIPSEFRPLFQANPSIRSKQLLEQLMTACWEIRRFPNKKPPELRLPEVTQADKENALEQMEYAVASAARLMQYYDPDFLEKNPLERRDTNDHPRTS